LLKIWFKEIIPIFTTNKPNYFIQTIRFEGGMFEFCVTYEISVIFIIKKKKKKKKKNLFKTI